MTAMEEEAVALRGLLERPVERMVGRVGITSGTLGGAEVSLVATGIGKVAAAAAATTAILVLQPALLTVVGLAGSLSAGAPPGTLVVATDAVQHDFDLRPLMERRGELPQIGAVSLAAHAPAVEVLEGCCRSALGCSDVGISDDEPPGEGSFRRGSFEDGSFGAGPFGAGSVIRGRVLSGDQIVADEAVKAELAGEFVNARCVDMETAAVAQVAEGHATPWCAVRLVSDFADESFDVADVLGYCADVGAALMATAVSRFATQWRTGWREMVGAPNGRP